MIGPKTAASLREFAQAPEPPLPEQHQVETMIAKLAMATAQPKVSDDEAAERMELYWLALRDIPAHDLRRAFVGLVRGSKFLPTPAEVRSAAMQAGAMRNYRKSRARFLVWKHEAEWQPAKQLLAPDDALALLATIVPKERQIDDVDCAA